LCRINRQEECPVQYRVRTISQSNKTMLSELRIENMALIDSLQLDFSSRKNGLAVFTGETGAGKSIILQAIQLLAGSRGAASWIRNDCDRAVVEASFDLDHEHPEIRNLLINQDVEHDKECIIRRIISRNGRSRVYVNDRLVTARLVGELMQNLVNIASQHDHQRLLVPRYHLDFLDTFGELWEERQEFERIFMQFKQLESQLRTLCEQEKDKEQRRDFLQFQLSEIREANVFVDEDIQLEQERIRLKSSTTLAELAGKSHELLQGRMVENLAAIRKNMEQVAALDESARDLSDRIVSACFEVEDLEAALREYLLSIPTDPHRLDAITNRLGVLKQLQRKYGPSIENVLEYGEQAEIELSSLETVEKKIEALEEERDKLIKKVMYAADGLSLSRTNVADKLRTAMENELVSLNFHHTDFKVSLVSCSDGNIDGIQATGKDQVEFLFSANPGEPVKPLAKVASGGELSRLMLAMKCILARRDQVNTVVFDEVDAGIGGKAAEAVARKIVELSSHHQVLCITHLPQIAASADDHYMVTKQVENGRTVSTISSLVNDERIMELARMLGGDSLTEQTVAYAKELIESNSVRSGQ